MYRYKMVNNDEFKADYKKVLGKNILKSSLILISLVNIIIFAVLYLFSKPKLIIFICICSIVLILEALIFYNSYKKDINRILNSISNDEVDISFDEKGISLYQDSITRQISWQGVREVIVEEKDFLFIYKVNGVANNIFYFNFFDVEKEVLIKDIEKYVKVKRC